jgi:DNA-binding protein H-NS
MEAPNNQPSPAPVETSTPTPEPESLESIAQGLSVTEQANQFVSTVQPQYQQPQPIPPSYQPQQFVAPDPVTDPDGYRNYVAQQYQSLNKLNSTVEEVASKIGQWERMQAEQKINHDVDRAVTKVTEKVGLDKDMVEVALELEYRKNPSFKKIWDNRDRYPAALDKALEVLTGKISSKYQVRSDPQIAENIRAAKSAQLTTATTKQPEGLDQMDGPAFEKFWNSLRGQDVI